MHTPTTLAGSACTLLAAAQPTLAYLGPGIGAGAVAVVLGFITSIFLAVFSVVWYPFKRLLKKRKKPAAPAEADKS